MSAEGVLRPKTLQAGKPGLQVDKRQSEFVIGGVRVEVADAQLGGGLFN